MKYFVLLFALVLSLGSGAVVAVERSPASEDAVLDIVTPRNGELVKGEFRVVFGLQGMGVAPAGVKMPNTGHHHLLIDQQHLPVIDMPLPMTDQILHFGGGQTETTLKLAPGTHTLQLLLADHAHVPHDPIVISEKITITVIE